MIRAIIIDDEPNIVEWLSDYIKREHPQIELLGTAGNVQNGLTLVKEQQPNLVILDVELPDGTGMDLLNQIGQQSFQVIFITAHDKYAIDAFRFSAIQFLLKPIDPDDFKAAITKVEQLQNANFFELQLEILTEHLAATSQKIVIHGTESIQVLKISEILYLKAEGSYSNFVLEGEKNILSSKRLKIYEELLAPKGFLRVHHSYLINVPHIVRFDRVDSMLILQGQISIPVSQRRKDLLLSVLNNDFFL